MKFADLNFKIRTDGIDGVQAVHKFPNGWSVSVIRGSTSYGGYKGLYELAVMDKDGSIHYENTVADGDVRGYLTPEDVEKFGTEVENFE